MAMSEQHKSALAEGRRQSAAIKAYLEAMATKRPGRPVTAESLKTRIATLEEKIAAEANPLKRLDLIQQRLDAEQQAKSVGSVDLVSLEDMFVEHAAGYSDRKGIAYSAWRELGVPARVLSRAGITRTRKA